MEMIPSEGNNNKNIKENAQQQKEHTTEEKVDLCLISKSNNVIGKACIIVCCEKKLSSC